MVVIIIFTSSYTCRIVLYYLCNALRFEKKLKSRSVTTALEVFNIVEVSKLRVDLHSS